MQTLKSNAGCCMYKLDKLDQRFVRRLSDDAVIPPDPGNRDWQEYQEWLAKGNAPLPAYTPEELAEKQKADEAAAREKLIAEKMRELAISELKKEGKLPTDYRLNQK